MDRAVSAEYAVGQTLIRWPWKLTRQDGRLSLHDVARDPAENEDLASREPALVSDLERRLRATTSRTLADDPGRPDTRVIEKLRGLGYIQDGPADDPGERP